MWKMEDRRGAASGNMKDASRWGKWRRRGVPRIGRGGREAIGCGTGGLEEGRPVGAGGLSKQQACVALSSGAAGDARKRSSMCVVDGDCRLERSQPSKEAAR
ncbi:hypothetical protein BRADI_1g42404v3 [Brachypodium distachyon]|uniref:Uncharacterized protein n=1 Tax=Brachypodium distachyon TaxID=15368 RepID=A0A2K2DNV4_BRADI|nr:hypothetical protein BRADI_1g42404v3 [Brachypodium distachyon]